MDDDALLTHLRHRRNLNAEEGQLEKKERLMAGELEQLLERARRVQMSAAQREEQRRSFAYGNTRIENPLITRETVDRQAEALKAEDRAAREH
jgi:hypothetical protein